MIDGPISKFEGSFSKVYKLLVLRRCLFFNRYIDTYGIVNLRKLTLGFFIDLYCVVVIIRTWYCMFK